MAQRAFERVAKDGFRRQQADDQEGFGVEVEEVARVHQDVLLAQQARARASSSDRSAGTRTIADQPPSTGKHGAGRKGRGDPSRVARLPPHARVNRLPDRTAAPTAASAAASCTGVPTDRKVSATMLQAVERRAAIRGGPPTTIHPSLTCGSPSDFDAPPSENVSTGAFTARSVDGAAVSSG